METIFYEKLSNKSVKCNICDQFCKIEINKEGICKVRVNRNGILETLVYPKSIARSIDPIEKKPIYHVKPGSSSYSIATVGCNFKCSFCQNADIAQMPCDRGVINGADIFPKDIVSQALRAECDSIAYTYTEPTIYFELALETAKIAHQKNLLNIFVTNGFMSGIVIEEIAPYLDAANVDLKAFNDKFYQKYCKARLEPVKENLKLMKSLGIIVEVTTLLIPGLNDSPKELEQLACFIKEDLGQETPWHISRFHPCYQMNDYPATPTETLETAYKIGKGAGLYHVYAGNAPHLGLEDTYCHSCGTLLVKRAGYNTDSNIKEGKCPNCTTPVYGIY
ncbi:MAG: AmmeMemoRadiSam system radical SAM enzyme [Desulfobacteraceae bacterium]|nr:AmmeMemoRadiSam system radical SAM enzyme [Desulfobacteraceae bacterium]